MVADNKTLAYRRPDLVKEWDAERNDKTPFDISYSSAYRAWWTCSTCGYQWQTSVNGRNNGRGCSVCAGRVVAPGINDIPTTHPEYLSWWDDEIDPTTMSAGRRTSINWKCPRGHSFSRQIKFFSFKCPLCVENPLSEHSPHLLADWSNTNSIQPSEVSYNSARVVEWLCHECQHVWETPVYSRTNGTGCPQCSLRQSGSRGEDQLVQFFLGTGLVENVDFIRHYKYNGDNRKELDIFFPRQGVGIEYNGLYWHSESGGKSRDYHHSKWEDCQRLGIQLVMVWEDSYHRNPELVHQMLLHKLGLTSRSKVYARQTRVERISPVTSGHFLTDNHIQGTATGTWHIGLFSKEELVAVAVFKKTVSTVYLERYATSKQVVGGLGKIIKFLLKDCLEQKHGTITTFAAHEVSNGSLYERLGFTVDKVLAPDYWYLVRGERKHKFNYRLKRFREDPALAFQEGLSERELAALNGLPRIWDAGKTRYVLKF